MECKVCKGVYDSSNKFHRHLKKCCGLSKAEYYEKFYPRFDLWDNSKIPFKNEAQYKSTFFKSKTNAISWFKSKNTNEFSKGEALQVLRSYFLSKQFSKAPSQSELRCKKIPSIIGIETFGVSYADFCKDLGLDYCFANEGVNDVKHVEILTDTREQLPLFTDRIEKLEVGDYTTHLNFSGVFIERKSLNDFIGTFTRKENYERFQRELERVQELGFYLIVLCEVSFDEVFEWTNNFGGKSSGYSALVKMCDFMQSFDCCQFVFPRKDSNLKELVKILLGVGDSVKTNDLQLMIDLKKI